MDIFDKIKQLTFQEVKKNTKLYRQTCDMMIKLGFIPTLNGYEHYYGDIDKCILKKVENLQDYIKDLLGNKIVLKNNNKWIFVVPIKDIEEIINILDKHTYKYKNYEIYTILSKKLKHVTENVLDLEPFFQSFKDGIKNVNFNDINYLFSYGKITLQLRFHQDLITHKLMKRIDSGKKSLLLGAKARYGKTYYIGGLFSKYYKKYNTLNALVITPAPTETLTQFTDDLFSKFNDFVNINLISITDSKQLEDVVEKSRKNKQYSIKNLKDNNIIIVSKQLLDDYVGTGKIKNFPKLDFVVFDENHFHGTTEIWSRIKKHDVETKILMMLNFTS